MFLGRSEGLQGFGWMSRVKIFFHKFWLAIFLFKKQPKNHVFHYMLCFKSLFEGPRHN